MKKRSTRSTGGSRRRGTGSGVRDAVSVAAPVLALTITDVVEDLNVAERALFRLMADERRRGDANFAAHELDVLFAAHHAIKGLVGLLRARDPWKEEEP